MSRGRWLVLVLLLVLAGGYLAYDITRACTGGPVTQLVRAAANGGSYTVRCAG